MASVSAGDDDRAHMRIDFGGQSCATQFNALFLKNMAFQGRQTITNVCQVFVPIFFIGILWLVTDLLNAAQEQTTLDLTACLNVSSLEGSTACSGLYFAKVSAFELNNQREDNATAGEDGDEDRSADRFMVDPYVKFLIGSKSDTLGENKNTLPEALMKWYLRLRTEANFAKSCSAQEDQCNFFSYTEAAPRFSSPGVCDSLKDHLKACNTTFTHPQDGTIYETCQYGDCLKDAPVCTCETGYSGDSCRNLEVKASARTARVSDRPKGCEKNKGITVRLDNGQQFNPYFCAGRYSTSAFEYEVPNKAFDAVLRREHCAQERAWCDQHYKNITDSVFEDLPEGYGDGSKDSELEGTVSGFLSHIDLPFMYQEDTASLSPFVFNTMYGAYASNDARRNARWVFSKINVFRQLEFIKATGAKDISKKIVDRWGKAPEAVIGAYDVQTKDASTGALEYTAYINQTAGFFYNSAGGKQDMPSWITMMSNAMLQESGGSSFATMAPCFQGMPSKYRSFNFDILAFLVVIFLWYIIGFQSPVYTMQLVYEKEFKMRQIMRLSGLNASTYWAVNFVFHLALYAVLVLVTLIIMAGIQRQTIFSKIQPSIWAVLLILFGVASIMHAWFISVFFNKTQTAVVVAFGIWFLQILLAFVLMFNNAFAGTFGTGLSILFNTMPFLSFIQFTFYAGLTVVFGGVITWNDIYLGGGGVFGKLPLGDCLMAMFVQIFVYLLLTLYLDSVFGPDQRNCCFCLAKRTSVARDGVAKAGEEEEKYVQEERLKVENDDTCMDEQYVVRMRNLRKEYPTKDGSFVAVDNLSLGVRHGECLGMLGPNGAGKTTTINMLCGMFLPTAGRADMYTKDLVDDIKEIQKVMGVCPQHDLLWGSLTGQEHLLFYGRLRGLKGAELDKAVRVGLADVSLTFAAKKAAKAYSGGMKRRLSVACCLIGKPKIVYLDEPSTGLDPASRRKLWDVIRRASKDCAMILTTHSMEEADALCDRITIMAGGKLRCLGSGALLKAEYGEGYKFSVSCPEDQVAASDSFVRDTVFAGAPEGAVTQLNSLSGTTNYTVSNDVVKQIGLSGIFKTMEQTKSMADGKLAIGDWGISEGTLEEVFSTITKRVVQSGQTKTEEELRQEKAARDAEAGGKAQMEFAGAPGFSSWWSAMPVHTYWLLRKNFLIYRRNANATGFLLGAGVIIMLFLRLMQELQGSGGGDQIYIGEDLDPTVYSIPKIPICTPGEYDDCRSLIVYKPYCDDTECHYVAGSAVDATVDSVVERLIINNNLPGISVDKGVEVRTYNSSDEDWKQQINDVLAKKMNYTKLQLIIPTHFGVQIDCNRSAGNCFQWAAKARAQWGDSYSYDGSCTGHPYSATDDFKCKMDYRFQLQTNTTATCPQFGILGCDRPTEELTWPAMAAVQNAIYQVVSGKTDAPWTPKWTTFPHGDLTWRFQRSIVNAFVPRFGLAAIIFMFVVQLGLLVREKELKLREALRMVGLKDAAYWLSWLVINCTMTFIGTLAMIGCAVLVNVKPVIVTDFAVSFSIFFSFALSMVAMTFIIASVLSNSKSATVLGFAFFIVAYLFGDLIGSLYDGKSNSLIVWQKVLQFLSPVMFLRAAGSMSTDTLVSGEGMRWECAGRFGCVDVTNDKQNYPVITCINWMIIDTFIYFVLGWYLDKTLPSEYGSAEPLWFFLNPFWWCGATAAEPEPEEYHLGEEKLSLDGKPEEKDVEDMARSTLMNDYDNAETFVEIKRLKKTFGGNCTAGCWKPQEACCASEDTSALLCCCCCHPFCGLPYPMKAPTFHAVKGVSYVIPEDELFCLLGPNGAGKTTTINMMTGLHPQTSGQIKVDGHSVKTDMNKVRKIMGCCPQHDILWNELTAGEHVELFARLKGVAIENLANEVTSRLEAVDLAAVRDRLAGAFSGGMLRRLSVTLSLTGEPKIAYMDEPTTGMDPVSRRHVWDLIEQCKKGRTILLTTHSMEEADVLGNTIAIMGKGRLRAFGTSLHLKNIFGAGYQLTFTCEENSETEVRDLIKAADPHMELLDIKQRSIIFRHSLVDAEGEAPGSKLNLLCSFLEQLESDKSAFKVNDYSIAMTTLEEVFLALCKSDEEVEMGKRVAELEATVRHATSMHKSGQLTITGKDVFELESLADALSPLLTAQEARVLAEAQDHFMNASVCKDQEYFEKAVFHLKKLLPVPSDIIVSKAVCNKNLAQWADQKLAEDSVVSLNVPHCGRVYQVPVHHKDVANCPEQGMRLPGQLVQLKTDPITMSYEKSASYWAEYEASWLGVADDS